MTEADLLSLLSTAPARTALETLSQIPQRERRKHAKTVVQLYNDLSEMRFSDTPKRRPKVRDEEAVTIGLLATATLTDLKKADYFPFERTVPLVEIFTKLRPDWTQSFVEHFVETRPNLVGRVAPLWAAGLCARPEGDAIILGYYALFPGDGEHEATLLEHDVWRFFEVEGGGEFSLANHDKYAKSGTESWQSRLVAYAEAGKLDRQRLLDASLDALERDFGQYRAGWYSRFHVALAPTPGEMAARADRYVGLLGSSVPPTVSFAIKVVQALDKASAIAPGELLAGLEPALQAHAKGTVAAALKLMARAAKREPGLQEEAARSALLALVCEDAALQDQALDLYEKLSSAEPTVRQADLADYIDLVAPSVRARIAALAGVDPAPEAAPRAPAAPTVAAKVIPVGSADEALALFLTVLETPRDPFEVERAVDGLSRFGPELRPDDQRLSPLRKRAKQVWENRGDTEIRAILALTGRAICEGAKVRDLMLETSSPGVAHQYHLSSLPSFHVRRNGEMSERVMSGAGLPLLSLPSDASGTVSAADLRLRLAAYDGAAVTPGAADLSLALMRLAIEERDIAFEPRTEGDRALAFALGANVPIGPTPEVWAAAWRARRPVQADPGIAALFDSPLPDCGVPVQNSLDVSKTESSDGAYFWVNVEVPAAPDMPNEADILPAIYAFHPTQDHRRSFSCGMTYADIAWAALIMPTDPEPLFRQGILMQDTWQKLTDNHTRAFLEPFFRPGPAVGPLGAGLLAYDMACEDKSVSSLAADAAALLLRQGRMTEEQLAAALGAFLMSESLPTPRWTKALAAMADAGAERHVREVIARLLDFPAAETPKDMGGMLELLYELHVAASTSLDRPEALACLETIKGGGKVAKFSKKLRALAPEAA